jgi:hypothetical protein
VFPLVSNRPDYDGMAQYAQWLPALADDLYGAAVNMTSSMPPFTYGIITQHA